MTEPGAFKFKLSPAYAKYFAPEAPRDAKMMAARGLVPMPPPVLAMALTLLAGNDDAEIRKAAHESLSTIPPNVVLKICSEEMHPRTLDFFARQRADHAEILEAILLNKLALDDTFAFLAERVSERLATLIGNNQVRLMRTPAIAAALRKNPHALRSEVDRVVSFLRINGIQVEGESPELTPAEIQEILHAQEPGVAPASPADAPAEFVDDEIPPELIEEEPMDMAPTEDRKKNIGQLIATLSVAKKVKLALTGNKEARSLLIKDSNKIVSTSVVKSPRITDGEIIAISLMRSVTDEVIRLIASNPDHAKNYFIQSALANNPKTPFPVALKFVRQLHIGDLQKLSKNKNVSGQIQKLAKDLYDQKKK